MFYVILELPYSIYHDLRSRKKSNRGVKDEKFKKEIISIGLDNKKSYVFLRLDKYWNLMDGQ